VSNGIGRQTNCASKDEEEKENRAFTHAYSAKDEEHNNALALSIILENVQHC
jgi:uncharacterized protein YeaO (DUF488 family)